MKNNRLKLTNREQQLNALFDELQDVMRQTWTEKNNPYGLIISSISIAGENDDCFAAYVNRPVVALRPEDYARLGINGKLVAIEAASLGTGSVVLLRAGIE